MIYNFSADAPHWKKGQTNRGEDSAAISENGILIICDGVGGSGSFSVKFNTLPKNNSNNIISEALKDVLVNEEYRWAYLGSRLCSLAAKKFLSENYSIILQKLTDEDALNDYAINLGKYIQSIFTSVIEDYPEVYPNGVPIGKKLFATTLTAVVFSNDTEKTSAIVFSAGDSHAKWWDVENGLSRISYGNSSDYGSDSKMDGAIFGDRSFQIHYMSYPKLPSKGVIFACSDGVTDPLPPPKYEFILVSEWLKNANIISNRKEYEAFISNSFISLGLNQGDDCSLAGAVVGYENQLEFNKALDSFRKPEVIEFSDFYDKKRKIQQSNNNPDEIVPLYKGIIYKKLKNISQGIEEPGPKFIDYISSCSDYRTFAEYQLKRLNARLIKSEEEVEIANDEVLDSYLNICVKICICHYFNQNRKGFINKLYKTKPFGIDFLDNTFYDTILERYNVEEKRKNFYNQYNSLLDELRTLLSYKSFGEITVEYRANIHRKYDDLDCIIANIFTIEPKFMYWDNEFKRIVKSDLFIQIFRQDSNNKFQMIINAVNNVLQKTSTELIESNKKEFDSLFEILKQKKDMLCEKEITSRNCQSQNLIDISIIKLFLKDKISQIRDDIITNHPKVFEELSGISFEEFIKQQGKIDITPYIEKLDGLWNSYKDKYERFRLCSIYNTLTITK